MKSPSARAEFGFLEGLFDTLEYTFLAFLDDEGCLLQWSRSFARLFPKDVVLQGQPLDALLARSEADPSLIHGSASNTITTTQLLRTRHSNHYYRCATLTAEGKTLVCGERLNIADDQVFNTLSQLTNEMAGMNMKLEQKHRELKVAYGEIHHISQTDSLTNLPNRRCFMENLQAAMELTLEGAAPFSLVLFDLDHFKQINDRFGHDAGDRVLHYFAGLLKKHGRKGDLSARFGGEEFIALLPETKIDGARFFAERIREELSVQKLLDEEYRVTVSAGICRHEPHLSCEELIKRADLALYSAKNGGRNRTSIYANDVEGPSRRGLTMSV